ncbi:MAG: CBS domain-containing protein [Candidatus Nitrosocaldaceae archaeon]
MKLKRVTEIMTEYPLDTIEQGLSIQHAANIMKERGRGSLVVLDNKKPIGIITERDIVRRVVAEGRDLNIKVKDVMSTPLITVGPEATVEVAAKIMYENGIRRLPVVENDNLLGIVTATDFVKHMLKEKKDSMLLAMARFKYIEELNK